MEAVSFSWLVLEGFALWLTCRDHVVLGSCSPCPPWPLKQRRMRASGSSCQILQQPTREQLPDSCQQEFRDLPLPCAAGPAKELIQCRDNKTRSVIFFPPPASNSLCQPRTHPLSVAMAAPGAAELGAGAGPAGAALWGSEFVCLAALPELLSALGTNACRRDRTSPFPWPHPFLAA